MAYRKTSYRSARSSYGRRASGRKLQMSQVLPIWSTAHTDTVNMAAKSIFHGWGITDLKGYWDKLRPWIVFCIFVSALFGASRYGIKGFVLGTVLGFATPAVLVWLSVLAVGIALYLTVYCLAWVAIWFVVMWLLHS